MVGEGRLHERAHHIHTGMLRAGDGPSRPVGPRHFPQLFDFARHFGGADCSRSEIAFRVAGRMFVPPVMMK